MSSDYHPHLDGPAEPYALSIDGNGNPLTITAPRKNGRPVIMEQRASVVQRARANGEPYWIAQVRGANCSRTHLGPHRTRARALAACERFIATGVKPPGAKRGMKQGQRKKPGSRTRWGTVTGTAPAAKRVTATEIGNLQREESRIAMMKRVWGRLK